MTNKKNLLSIAAAIAISSTVLTAGYVPLTTDTTDAQKVFYKKNGFKEHKDLKLVAFMLDK